MVGSCLGWSERPEAVGHARSAITADEAGGSYWLRLIEATMMWEGALVGKALVQTPLCGRGLRYTNYSSQSSTCRRQRGRHTHWDKAGVAELVPKGMPTGDMGGDRGWAHGEQGVHTGDWGRQSTVTLGPRGREREREK
jgi:hypothetical protein